MISKYFFKKILNLTVVNVISKVFKKLHVDVGIESHQFGEFSLVFDDNYNLRSEKTWVCIFGFFKPSLLLS